MQFLTTILSTLALAVSLGAAAPTESGPTESLWGDATWYDPAGGYGACGPQLNFNSPIVALGPAYSGNCGRMISVYYNSNGRQARIQAQVQDLCPGCPDNNIDLSGSKFQEMTGDLGIGRTTITWDFI